MSTRMSAAQYVAGHPRIRPPRKSKYRNEKTAVDEILFDSKRESVRYRQLRALLAAGEISDLRLQVKFILIPAQRRADGSAERACTYVADFAYQQDGCAVVEDVKGVKTPDYVMKRKLMLHVHGITVLETS